MEVETVETCVNFFCNLNYPGFNDVATLVCSIIGGGLALWKLVKRKNK